MTQHCPEQNWIARKKEAQCKPGLKRSQEGGRIPREDAENGSRTKHVSVLPMHATASPKGRDLAMSVVSQNKAKQAGHKHSDPALLQMNNLALQCV